LFGDIGETFCRKLELMAGRARRRNGSFQLNLVNGVADEDCEISGADTPFARGGIEVRERAAIEQYLHTLSLSLAQIDADESFQFLGGPRHVGMNLADVDLGDVRA
jgi:hypothetical protein